MPKADPYRYFRGEARELLEGMQAAALALEKGAEPKAALQALLRQAHTLKGAARVVRLPAVADGAHAVEALLAPGREGGALAPGTVDGLLALLDGIAARLAELDAPPAPKAAAPAPGQAAAPPPPDRRMDSVRLELAELDAVIEGQREALGHLGQLRAHSEALPPARRLAQGLLARSAVGSRERATAQELYDLLARLERGTRDGLEQSEAELQQAQERAARLRLQPASLLFSFLERACRDAAAALGKDLRFEAEGGEQRLDAPVLSALQEGLQHVVRNAVAHGIESPAERLAAGKPAQGSLRISLRRQDGRLRFLCADDGRGIDVAAVRAAAARKGVLPAGAPATLSVEQALTLLLQGGLSTAAQVTEIAGRGLGLDVLRSSVERLKGTLEFRSRAGLGLELELSVPLSLASYAVLAVESGGQAALIPFDAVRTVLSLSAAQWAEGPGGGALKVGGEALAFAPLAACLGLDAPERARAALILRGGEGSVALGVERILGVREALVLPLPELAPAPELALGASLDALGEPCLVLDPDALLRAARRPRAARGEAPRAEALPLLVVDDSLTTRMLEQGILETAGYQVDLAVSGEEGLDKARARAYGLILVDVEMPGMSGFDFVEALGRDPQLRSVPAILVSSRSAAEDRRRGLAAGARDYIVKGEFDQARLLGRIRELLA